MEVHYIKVGPEIIITADFQNARKKNEKKKREKKEDKPRNTRGLPNPGVIKEVQFYTNSRGHCEYTGKKVMRFPLSFAGLVLLC